MDVLRLLADISAPILLACLGFQIVARERRRRRRATLRVQRNQFIAERLASQFYLFQDDEEGREKLEATLEELDDEWFYEAVRTVPKDRVDLLASFIGNVDIRRAGV